MSHADIEAATERVSCMRLGRKITQVFQRWPE